MDTSDGLPTLRKDDIEYKDKDYYYLPHKEWCDLLYTLDSNDESKRSCALSKRNNIPKSVQKSSYNEGSLSFHLNNKKASLY